MKARTFVETASLLYNTSKSDRTFTIQVLKLMSLYQAPIKHLNLIFKNLRPIDFNPECYYVGAKHNILQINPSGCFFIEKDDKIMLGQPLTIDALIHAIENSRAKSRLKLPDHFIQKVEFNDEYLEIANAK